MVTFPISIVGAVSDLFYTIVIVWFISGIFITPLSLHHHRATATLFVIIHQPHQHRHFNIITYIIFFIIIINNDKIIVIIIDIINIIISLPDVLYFSLANLV